MPKLQDISVGSLLSRDFAWTMQDSEVRSKAYCILKSTSFSFMLDHVLLALKKLGKGECYNCPPQIFFLIFATAR